MSITITCQFENGYKAHQAAERLRRKGFMVSNQPGPRTRETGDLLVAPPLSATTGYTFGNHLMGSLPPMAGGGVMVPSEKKPVISVLTDDTQSAEAQILMESLGGTVL